MTRHLVAVALLGLFAPLNTASAQLSISLLSQFVDTQAGGNGNIGVTQDELAGNIYVIDFSNTNTVHEFTSTGTYLNGFPTAGCTPPAGSPNDVVWDDLTDSLWVVDNSVGGTVTNVSRAGACLGGFALGGLSNAVGITYERTSQTLFVSHTAAVSEYDKLGNLLGGGFAFTPPSGSSILSGVTHVPSLGNFLVTSSGGDKIYEVTPAGALVSTTDLASFGIGNTQGLHYNQTNGTILVVDNSLSTVFVFALDCVPSLPYGTGCAGTGGFVPTLDVAGCPELGGTIAVTLAQGLGGATSALLVSLGPASAPIGGGCTLLVQPTPFVLTIPLGGGAPGSGTFTLPGVIPLTAPIVDVYLQGFVADPGTIAGLSATNGVKMPLQS